MTLDRRAADRRRFALVTGLADGTKSGLPVGRQQPTEDAEQPEADGIAEPRTGD